MGMGKERETNKHQTNHRIAISNLPSRIGKLSSDGLEEGWREEEEEEAVAGANKSYRAKLV